MPRMLVILMIAGLALALAGAALADASPAPNPVYRGLGLTTPFPNQTVRAGEPVTLTVTVKNYGLPPQVVNLSVVQRAAGAAAASITSAVPSGSRAPAGSDHAAPRESGPRTTVGPSCIPGRESAK